MDGTIIRGGKENIIVERLMSNVVVDRYLTDDLAKPPKRLASWMLPVLDAGKPLSASEVLQRVEYLKPPQPNVWDRLDAAKRDLSQLTEDIAYLRKEVSARERTIDTLCRARMADQVKIEALQDLRIKDGECVRQMDAEIRSLRIELALHRVMLAAAQRGWFERAWSAVKAWYCGT